MRDNRCQRIAIPQTIITIQFIRSRTTGGDTGDMSIREVIMRRNPLLPLYRLVFIGAASFLCLILFTYLSDKFGDEMMVNKVPVAVIEELTKLDSSTREILEVAESIHSTNKTVLLTLINYAYLPLAYSWLCNTKHLGIHSQVLFVTSDQSSHRKLKRDWPEVKSVVLRNIEENGDQDYMHAGYARLVIRRSEIILKILELNIPVFLFETDCVWLTNPLPILNRYNDYDVLVNPVSDSPGIFNGGLIYIYPTDAMKRLWTVLTVNLLKEYEKIRNIPKGSYVKNSDWDQSYFSELVMKNFGGISYKLLPLTNFPDGKWYGYSAEQRKQFRPLVICNNWIIGNAAKIDRAKKWGHWFLLSDMTCDSEKIAAIFQKR